MNKKLTGQSPWTTITNWCSNTQCSIHYWYEWTLSRKINCPFVLTPSAAQKSFINIYKFLMLLQHLHEAVQKNQISFFTASTTKGIFLHSTLLWIVTSEPTIDDGHVKRLWNALIFAATCATYIWALMVPRWAGFSQIRYWPAKAFLIHSNVRDTFLKTSGVYWTLNLYESVKLINS